MIDLKPNSHIHFMGICGTAMASLAGIMKQNGFRVTGSDQNVYPPMSTQLESLGIQIQSGYRGENLVPVPDLVVVGNVISRSNPEAQALLESKIPYVSLPQALGDLVIENRHSIVMSGTHGKTTTTSMMAWVADACVEGVGYLIGGIPKNFSKSFEAPKGDWFVIEGDEYDTAFFDKVPKFIYYKPKSVIFTSCEFDHADIYDSIEDIKKAFSRLIGLIPKDGTLVYCSDDPIVSELSRQFPGKKIGYGISSGDAYVKNVTTLNGATEFEVILQGKSIGQVRTPSYGHHNILNTLAVVALSHSLGWDIEKIKTSVASFEGVKRRQEILGTPGGVRIIEDFAHHPTAVKLTVEAVKEKFKSGKLFAIFEPRSATSRRKIFQKEYSEAFDKADVVYIAKAFDQGKIVETDRFSSEDLVEDLKHRKIRASVGENADDIVKRLKNEASANDSILIMSNGGFDGIYQKLIGALEKP